MPGENARANPKMKRWLETELYPMMRECEAKVERLLSSTTRGRSPISSWNYGDSPDDIVARRRKASSNGVRSSGGRSTPSSRGRIVTHLEPPIADDSQDVDAIEQLQQFLQQSAAHQRHMENVKRQRREAEAQYVPDTQGPIELPLPSDAAPTSRPHQSRYEALATLYGDCADSIVSMETNLQARFDRSVDSVRPRYWPIIPLRF